MANNYVLFSTLVPLRGGDPFPVVKKILTEGVIERGALVAAGNWDVADELGFDFQFEWGAGGSLIIYSEEAGNVDHAAEFIRTLMQKGLAYEPHVLGWANTCTKARPDEFGGGAILITKKKLYWFDPLNGATKKWEGIKKARKVARKKKR